MTAPNPQDVAGFPAILLLAVGLAMDAVAVSAARGAAAKRLQPRDVLTIGLLFGGFQAGMPLIGYVVGASVGGFVSAWGHWIVFAVLAFFGVRMIVGALRHEPEAEADEDAGRGLGLKVLVVLAIATSLDALAVGVTLPFADFPLALSVVTIGVVTALASGAAIMAGVRFGAALGSKAELVGGLVLVGLGTKILVEHLVG